MSREETNGKTTLDGHGNDGMAIGATPEALWHQKIGIRASSAPSFKPIMAFQLSFPQLSFVN